MGARSRYDHLVAIVACLVPSCIGVIARDRQKAGAAATQSAQATFVKQDLAGAHMPLSNATRRGLPAPSQWRTCRRRAFSSDLRFAG
jgi:hypothetical protein